MGKYLDIDSPLEANRLHFDTVGVVCTAFAAFMPLTSDVVPLWRFDK